MLVADFYPSTKRTHATVVIARVTGGRRSEVETIAVSGKRDARQIAAECGATPNNF